jgi:hypothetical protein
MPVEIFPQVPSVTASMPLIVLFFSSEGHQTRERSDLRFVAKPAEV